MKATNANTGHNRTILVSDLPPGSDLRELTITVNYTREQESPYGDAGRAVVLDSIIIPAIIRGLNKRRIVCARRQTAQLQRPT